MIAADANCKSTTLTNVPGSKLLEHLSQCVILFVDCCAYANNVKALCAECSDRYFLLHRI